VDTMQSTALNNIEGIETVVVEDKTTVPSTLDKYRAIWGDERFWNRGKWRGWKDIEVSGVMKWLEKIEAEATKQEIDDTARKWMTRVMYCESGGYEGAKNPKEIQGQNATGCYQYMPSTWRAKWNFNRDRDIYDCEAQIEATAYKYKLGGKGIWECK